MTSSLALGATARALVVFLILARLISQDAAVQAQDTEPITLDAGNGQTAELTDYSLTNYGQTPSGRYSGDFCVTLRNTSFPTQPRLPIYLVAVGLLAEADLRYVGTQPISYPDTFEIGSNLEDIRFGLETVAVGKNASGGYGNLLSGPTDGLGYLSSGTFCFRTTRPVPFTSEDMLEKLAVVFSDETVGCYTIGEVKGVALVRIETFSDDSLGLSIRNVDTSGRRLGRLLFGAAFEVSETEREYSLSVDDDLRQAGFAFTDDDEKLSQKLTIARGFDFGIFRNGSGLDTGQSVGFTVTGEFDGLTTDQILRRALVRFGKELASQSDVCGLGGPSGEGIRGSVATVPR